MGDAQTLKDFLAFAKENYPAKRTAVVFWNHGGGSVSGAAFDELYGMDSLSLAEMYQAFSEVFGENPENQPVDIVGFDTCLMATVDTAYTFSDIGKYLVASQELEPGNGWLYSGWLGALAEAPDLEPLALSKVICDSYDFEAKAYFIKGARKPLDESAAADKNLRYLVEGDVIQTIHFATSLTVRTTS